MSGQEDKKFSLDELPDEGSEFQKPSPAPRPKKISPDPRVEKVKAVDDKAKIQIMETSWTFDVRERNVGWIAYVAILCLLESLPIYDQYLAELNLADKSFFESGGEFIREFTLYLELIIRHPAVFVILTPFFFQFSRNSDYLFEITYDGIKTVKSFLPLGSKELVTRTIVKWGEIVRVEKKTVDRKEILRFYAVEGHIGDIIWYIDIEKKKAIKLLLNGLVTPQHPLRTFLNHEKELK